MKAGQAARLKQALKQQAAREENPTRKGDLVAVTIVHRQTVSMYGRNVLAVNASDHISYHLGRVTKADRTGRAVKVQLVGHPGAPIDAFDKVTRTSTIRGRQERCEALAKIMTEPAHNDFQTRGELIVAVLTGETSPPVVTVRLDRHDPKHAGVSIIKVQDGSVVSFEGVHPNKEAEQRAAALCIPLGCTWRYAE